jgi:acyl-CoA thioesterase FadM
MAVETRVTRTGEAGAGALLRVHSRITSVGRKSFATRHFLGTDGGAPVAEVAHSLVAVDLAARRAVAVPDFLARLRPPPGEG